MRLCISSGEGGNEVDAVVAGEVFPGHGLDHRRQVDGIDQLGFWEILRDAAQGAHDVLHGPAIVLPPVAGDQDDLAAGVVQVVE